MKGESERKPKKQKQMSFHDYLKLIGQFIRNLPYILLGIGLIFLLRALFLDSLTAFGSVFIFLAGFFLRHVWEKEKGEIFKELGVD